VRTATQWTDGPNTRFSRAETATTGPSSDGGRWTVLDAGDERVLAHRCVWLEGAVIAVHNPCGEEVEARLALDDGDRFADATDVFGNEPYDQLEFDDPRFPLPAFSCYPLGRAQRSLGLQEHEDWELLVVIVSQVRVQQLRPSCEPVDQHGRGNANWYGSPVLDCARRLNRRCRDRWRGRASGRAGMPPGPPPSEGAPRWGRWGAAGLAQPS
jgi:hypothetical protein